MAHLKHLFYYTIPPYDVNNFPKWDMGKQQGKNYLVALFATLCIAQQNLSIGVNVVSEGHPRGFLKFF